MLFIPGVMFTNSLRDMFSGDTITGLIRCAESLLLAVILFCIFAGAAERVWDGNGLQKEDNFFAALAQGERLVFVIDPGHGGENLGAEYDGYTEKEITMPMAIAMKEELEKR